jgi:hypothetical protein
MNIIFLKEHRARRCDDEPGSLRCTDRLVACVCPGKALDCVSSKFDPKKDNKDLPKFYMAQHYQS